MLRGRQKGSQRGEGDKTQIERPDAQDPAQIKAAEIQAAGGCALAQEQAGDEVGAQGEEKIHTVSAAGENGNDGPGKPPGNSIGIVKAGNPWKSMEEKHS